MRFDCLVKKWRHAKWQALCVEDGGRGRDDVVTKAPVVQARAIETRTRILERSIQTFAEPGFDATSLTSDILDPAGVSVGSFYHQFSNKHEVLIELLATRGAARQERIAELDCARQRGALMDALHTLFDDVETAPEAWMVQFRAAQNPDASIRSAVRAGCEGWERLAGERDRALLRRDLSRATNSCRTCRLDTQRFAATLRQVV